MKTLYLIVLLSGTFSLKAQTLVKGIILDQQGAPVTGANVYLQDTYDGGTSGGDGAFSFETEESGNQVLIVSFIGYEEKHMPVSLPLQGLLTITLKEQFDKLDGVTITAGAFEASDEKKGVILRPLDIATTAGATADIAGALNMLPGTQKVGETGRLFVRGGEGHETKTFIDGLWVQNPYNTTADNLPSRNRFSPFLFKGTLFSTGGYSAEYGQALSSTLVLNTIDFPEESQTDFSLMTVGGSIAHTQVGKKQAITGELGYTNLTPYFELIEQNQRWDAAPQAVNAALVYRNKINKTGLLKIYATANRANMELYQKDRETLTKDVPVGITNQYVHLNGTYRDAISDKWYVFAGLSYNYSDDAFEIDEEDLQKEEKGIHLKNTWMYDWSERLALRFGYEGVLNRSTFRFTDISFTAKKDLDDVLHGAFTEADVYLSTKVTARAGVRWDHSTLLKENALVPRVSLAYKTGEKSQVSMAYGGFVQKPQDDWLRESARLDFEVSRHYILNYQWSANDRTLRTELYHKEYNQLVQFERRSPVETIAFSNLGRGYTSGLDLFWRDRKSIKNADYWISYSYLDTRRQYLDYPEEAIPTFASRHNVSVVYKHFVSTWKAQLGGSISYTSPRPYHNPNGEGFNSERTKSFTEVSFNAAYLFRQHIIFYASVTNLLGTKNIFGYQYARQKDESGSFNREAITQGAPRFVFLGVFITLTRNKSKNQLDNL